MGVDYSTTVLYGVELDISFSEWINNVDPSWDTKEHRVEISQFGDRMTGENAKIIAFYQPSYMSFNDWSGGFGAYSISQIQTTINCAEANDAILSALDGIPIKGQPEWFVCFNVS